MFSGWAWAPLFAPAATMHPIPIVSRKVDGIAPFQWQDIHHANATTQHTNPTTHKTYGHTTGSDGITTAATNHAEQPHDPDSAHATTQHPS